MSISLFALIIIIFLIVLWYIGSRNGLSLKDILLWSLPRNRKDEQTTERNGTQKDVAEFVNRLLMFENKKKIRTVIPGMIRRGDKVLNISALIVAPGEIMGIVCMGFGGHITPDPEAAQWEQNLNGEVKLFPNPLKTCANLENQLTEALKEQNIQVKCRVVPVFTTPGVVFTTVPQGVYTVDSLFYTLDSAAWITEGKIDVNQAADALTAMVPMDELRAAAEDKPGDRKPRKKRGKKEVS